MIIIGIPASDTIRKKSGAGTNAATAIAMNDPDVLSEMANNNVRPITESRPFNSTTMKGFLNYTGNLVAVHIALRSPSVPPPDYDFYFIVDTDRGLIADKTTFFDVMAGDDEMILRPESAWYFNISRSAWLDSNGNVSIHLAAHYTPADAAVYQVVVGKEGFEKLRQTPAGIPLQSVDIARDILAFNGTVPRGEGWNGSVTLPSVEVQVPNSTPSTTHQPDGDYYLVLINGEKERDITLTLRVPMTGTIFY